MIRIACVMAALVAAPVQAADFNFCWLGAGGYSMTGRISFPDALMSSELITEADVTEFQITGYQQRVPIGQWDIASRVFGSTWHLRFNPQTLTFLTGGGFGTDLSQGWNADGAVRDCGRRGFGFNTGNYSQDFCLFGTWVQQSAIDPATPLRATTAPVSPNCSDALTMSKARMPE